MKILDVVKAVALKRERMNYSDLNIPDSYSIQLSAYFMAIVTDEMELNPDDFDFQLVVEDKIYSITNKSDVSDSNAADFEEELYNIISKI